MKQIFLVRMSEFPFVHLPFECRSVRLAYGQTHPYIHREKSGVDSFVFDRIVVRDIMVKWSWQLPGN